MGTHVRIKKNDLEKLAKVAPKEAAEAVHALALDAERYVKSIMASSPAGSTGASAPGNPPRIDTGALVNSMNTARMNQLLYAVRAGTDYAVLLEYGTSTMAARPFMGPMVVYVQKNASRFFERFLS